MVPWAIAATTMARGSSRSLAVPFWVDSCRCPFDRRVSYTRRLFAGWPWGPTVLLLAPSAEHSSNSSGLGLQRREPPARCQWYGASLSNTHCFHSEMSSRASHTRLAGSGTVHPPEILRLGWYISSGLPVLVKIFSPRTSSNTFVYLSFS